MLIRLEVEISDQKNTVRYRPMQSFCDEAACMDHILRSLFSRHWNQQTHCSDCLLLWTEARYRRIILNFSEFSNFFSDFLTAVNAEQT